MGILVNGWLHPPKKSRLLKTLSDVLAPFWKKSLKTYIFILQMLVPQLKKPPHHLIPSARPRKSGRSETLSVALPASIVENAQGGELKALLVGQMARALTIYGVDEAMMGCDGMGETDFLMNGVKFIYSYIMG